MPGAASILFQIVRHDYPTMGYLTPTQKALEESDLMQDIQVWMAIGRSVYISRAGENQQHRVIDYLDQNQRDALRELFIKLNIKVSPALYLQRMLSKWANHKDMTALSDLPGPYRPRVSRLDQERSQPITHCFTIMDTWADDAPGDYSLFFQATTPQSCTPEYFRLQLLHHLRGQSISVPDIKTYNPQEGTRHHGWIYFDHAIDVRECPRAIHFNLNTGHRTHVLIRSQKP